MATAYVAGAGQPGGLMLGPGHRARTNPSGAWLAKLGDVLLADPVVVGLLRISAC